MAATAQRSGPHVLSCQALRLRALHLLTDTVDLLLHVVHVLVSLVHFFLLGLQIQLAVLYPAEYCVLI